MSVAGWRFSTHPEIWKSMARKTIHDSWITSGFIVDHHKNCWGLPVRGIKFTRQCWFTNQLKPRATNRSKHCLYRKSSVYFLPRYTSPRFLALKNHVTRKWYFKPKIWPNEEISWIGGTHFCSIKSKFVLSSAKTSFLLVHIPFYHNLDLPSCKLTCGKSIDTPLCQSGPWFLKLVLWMVLNHIRGLPTENIFLQKIAYRN